MARTTSCQAGGGRQFCGDGRARFFSARPLEIMSMVLSQSERLRLIAEQARGVVSRNKTVDSSLITFKNQMRASKTSTPLTVPTTLNTSGCGAFTVATGVGTQMTQEGLLQKAAGCAICSDDDSVVNNVIILPTPCINFLAPPFTQQNLSTMYVAPCTNPGVRVYFPPVRPSCSTIIGQNVFPS